MSFQTPCSNPAPTSSLHYSLPKLANLSFQQGRFPTSLKLAQVTPLLKKTNLNPDEPSNYRPISNLNTRGKLLERLALAHLQRHILTSANFNNVQSVYRFMHSTETVMLKIVNDMKSAMDTRAASLLVSLDLTAAFNTINHQKLLVRLAQ